MTVMSDDYCPAPMSALEIEDAPPEAGSGASSLMLYPFSTPCGHGEPPPASDAGAIMPDDLLERTIQQFLAHHPGPEAVFTWRHPGPGEAGIAFFRTAIQLQHQHAREGLRRRNVLVTSGSGIDGAWCRFLAEAGFEVVLELNGPRRLHDQLVQESGAGAPFDVAFRALKRLQRMKVNCSVRCAVSRVNSDFPSDVYLFLREENVRQIEFEPVVTHLKDGTLAAWSVEPESFGRFLTAVFDEWVKSDAGRVKVQHFEAALEAFRGCRSSLCVHAGTCGTAVAVQAEGEVFSCQEFMQGGHYLGSVSDQSIHDLAASPFQRRFGAEKQDSLPGCCRECPVLFLCNGGCPKHRFTVSPDGEPGLNYLCGGYKRFFLHITPLMSVLAMLRENELPMSLMARTLQETLPSSPRSS